MEARLRERESAQKIFSHCPFRSSCWVFLPADPLIGLRPFLRFYYNHLIIFWRSLWALCLPKRLPVFLGILLVPKRDSCFLGAPKFSVGLLRLQAISWEVLSLSYFLFVQQQRISLEVSFLISEGPTLGGRISSSLCRGGENIIIGNTRNCLKFSSGFFNYRLTFSRGEFSKCRTLYLWLFFKK